MWTFQAVTNVGIQVVCLLALGYIFAWRKFLEQAKFLPQTNIIILMLALPAFNLYLMGIKLDLQDADAWKSLAAFLLWVWITQGGIVLYTWRFCGGDAGEAAVVNMVLLMDNYGIVGLLALNATLGTAWGPLSLLMAMGFFLVIFPFSLTAFEWERWAVVQHLAQAAADAAADIEAAAATAAAREEAEAEAADSGEWEGGGGAARGAGGDGKAAALEAAARAAARAADAGAAEASLYGFLAAPPPPPPPSQQQQQQQGAGAGAPPTAAAVELHELAAAVRPPEAGSGLQEQQQPPQGPWQQVLGAPPPPPPPLGCATTPCPLGALDELPGGNGGAGQGSAFPHEYRYCWWSHEDRRPGAVRGGLGGPGAPPPAQLPAPSQRQQGPLQQQPQPQQRAPAERCEAPSSHEQPLLVVDDQRYPSHHSAHHPDSTASIAAAAGPAGPADLHLHNTYFPPQPQPPQPQSRPPALESGSSLGLELPLPPGSEVALQQQQQQRRQGQGQGQAGAISAPFVPPAHIAAAAGSDWPSFSDLRGAPGLAGSFLHSPAQTPTAAAAARVQQQQQRQPPRADGGVSVPTRRATTTAIAAAAGGAGGAGAAATSPGYLPAAAAANAAAGARAQRHDHHLPLLQHQHHPHPHAHPYPHTGERRASALHASLLLDRLALVGASGGLPTEGPGCGGGAEAGGGGPDGAGPCSGCGRPAERDVSVKNLELALTHQLSAATATQLARVSRNCSAAAEAAAAAATSTDANVRRRLLAAAAGLSGRAVASPVHSPPGSALRRARPAAAAAAAPVTSPFAALAAAPLSSSPPGPADRGLAGGPVGAASSPPPPRPQQLWGSAAAAAGAPTAPPARSPLALASLESADSPDAPATATASMSGAAPPPPPCNGGGAVVSTAAAEGLACPTLARGAVRDPLRSSTAPEPSPPPHSAAAGVAAAPGSFTLAADAGSSAETEMDRIFSFGRRGAAAAAAAADADAPSLCTRSLLPAAAAPPSPAPLTLPPRGRSAVQLRRRQPSAPAPTTGDEAHFLMAMAASGLVLDGLRGRPTSKFVLTRPSTAAGLSRRTSGALFGIPLALDTATAAELAAAAAAAPSSGGMGMGGGAGGAADAEADRQLVREATAQALQKHGGVAGAVVAFASGHPQLWHIASILAKNPMIWTMFLAMAISVSGLRRFLDPSEPSYVPELGWIAGCLAWINGLVVPLSIFANGAWIYGKRLVPWSQALKMLVLFVVKVGALPILMTGCALAVRLDAQHVAALTLLTLCPAAAASFVLAVQYGRGVELVTVTNILGTVLLVPLLILWLQILTALNIPYYMHDNVKPISN